MAVLGLVRGDRRLLLKVLPSTRWYGKSQLTKCDVYKSILIWLVENMWNIRAPIPVCALLKERSSFSDERVLFAPFDNCFSVQNNEIASFFSKPLCPTSGKLPNRCYTITLCSVHVQCSHVFSFLAVLAMNERMATALKFAAFPCRPSLNRLYDTITYQEKIM